MNVKHANINSTPEILKRKLGGELLVPVTVTEFAGGVCKAGTPLDVNGAVANDATVAGILLDDVYEENPNGSLVKAFAVVNLAKAEAHSGVTLAQAAKDALANVVFE